MSFNFILDEYPTEVIFDEVVYPIETDFKVILGIIQLLDDDLFTDDEKINNSLNLFYSYTIPNSREVAYSEMLAFIAMYKENVKPDVKQPKLMDYEVDSGSINAAFIQIYNIDLVEVTMHWFKFNILLENLSDGKPRLLNIIEIRDMEIDQKLEPKQKAKLRKLKKEYSLEEEQDVNSFANAFFMGAMGGVMDE